MQQPVLRAISLFGISCLVGTVFSGAAVAGQAGDALATSAFSLHSVYPMAATGLVQTSESTTITTRTSSSGWNLSGPYFLRSADPEPVGQIDVRFIYGYATASEKSDTHDFGLEIEWGISEGLGFIFESGVELGNGDVKGNGDITIGFHTKFWDEDGLLPAFAMRNHGRFPTGYHDSSGVDYIGRGLFTWTLMPDKLRLHFNPFLKSINGNLGHDGTHFRWGAAVGFDCRMSDDLLMTLAYKHETSETEGNRNSHSVEWGADWKFASNQKLGLAAELGLDGDDDGSNFEFRISYILIIGG